MGDIPAAIACKRIILDETLVRAAERYLVLLDVSYLTVHMIYVQSNLST